MNIDLFDYELPDELIALHPPQRRDGGKLLVVDPAHGASDHRRITDLPAVLPKDALLVLNDTRVIPARLRARRPTGGAVEILLVRPEPSRALADDPSPPWVCLLRANKPLRAGDALHVGALTAQLREKGARGEGIVAFSASEDELRSHLERYGEVPLPPYLKREAEPSDKERYQTVFAREDGSVAAPTASLHFTPELLDGLRDKGIETAYVTLHVGPGTFRPIAAEDVHEHEMDAERYSIPEETARALRRARESGRPIVAAGTTATRALEGAFAQSGDIVSGQGMTRLFITPGYEFRVVDGLLTNFHLPRSTLLCLVSALAGRERILAAYDEAVRARYRFYSYGDAMLILPRTAR